MRPIKVFNELIDPVEKMPQDIEYDEEEDGEREEETVARHEVLRRYRQAAELVDGAMSKMIKECTAEVNVYDLCMLGDVHINENAKKFSTKKKPIKGGVAFPTCVSVNNCINHFSPLLSDSPVVLKAGDVVKIDMGAHVDGYASVRAHTLVVGASKAAPVTGCTADTIVAAYKAIQAAVRVIAPDRDTFEVTDVITKVVEEFDCKPIAGMASHQIVRNDIEGRKIIVQNPDEDIRKEVANFTFQVHEVYGLDVVITAGEGKYKEMEARTTVYKRNADSVYNLKLKTSRQFFTEVEKEFNTMAFTLRMCKDEKKARLGVVECVKHGLVEPFPVLCDKNNKVVAEFKYTVALLPDETIVFNRMTFDQSCYKSDKKVKDPELLAILARPLSKVSTEQEREEQQKEVWEDIERAIGKL